MNHPRKRQVGTAILSVSLFLLALFPSRLAASALTLAWGANGEDDLAGYKVYYGTQSKAYDSTIDVGNVSQYTVRGLEPEIRYYLALTAYDSSRNESDFSAEVSAVTEPGGSLTPIPDNEGGCFIATAAYGSSLNPHVKILRDFRDEFLISNSLGMKFVHLYYQFGPRIAKRTEEYGFLRFLSRQALLPLIGISLLSLKTTASPTLLFLSLCLILIFTLTVRRQQLFNRT
jgi:hypothetical protein